MLPSCSSSASTSAGAGDATFRLLALLVFLAGESTASLGERGGSSTVALVLLLLFLSEGLTVDSGVPGGRRDPKDPTPGDEVLFLLLEVRVFRAGESAKGRTAAAGGGLGGVSFWADSSGIFSSISSFASSPASSSSFPA